MLYRRYPIGSAVSSIKGGQKSCLVELADERLEDDENLGHHVNLDDVAVSRFSIWQWCPRLKQSRDTAKMTA